jgi:hypothetical protein
MAEFLKALTVAARSPLAMVGYLAALTAWLVVALTTKRASLLFRTIRSLSEADRLHAIELEYKTKPRSGLSAEQWIRSRVHLYIFAGFAITCFLLLTLVSYAIWLKAHSSQETIKNNVSIEHSTINQPGVVGIIDGGPEKSAGSEAKARPGETKGNRVQIVNSHIDQAGIVGTVVGNVYVTYSQVKRDASTTAPQLSDVRFITDDASINDARTTLAIRFSIFNNTPIDISIYDIKCVEYLRGHVKSSFSNPMYGEPVRRYELLIDAAHPFIKRDEMLPVPANGSSSFHIDLRVFPDINLTEVAFGVLIYYHDSKGNTAKLKSDKLYFALPAVGGVVSFDENSIDDVYNSIQKKTPSYCDIGNEGNLINCKHESLVTRSDDLRKALLLHRNL